MNRSERTGPPPHPRMSSFEHPHHMYLFAVKGSERRKLGYGKSPEDAFEVLSFWNSPEEMAELDPEDYLRIHQRDLQDYIHLLEKPRGT